MPIRDDTYNPARPALERGSDRLQDGVGDRYRKARPIQGSGGARLVAKVPHGGWRALTFPAALRCDRIAAPGVIDGPINGARFRAYVEQLLMPTLSAGDIVIIDNLGSDKVQPVRQLIHAAGVQLFFCRAIRPTSIRSNRVFSKLKTRLRKVDPRMAADRRAPLALHARGMRRLPHQRRLCARSS